MPLLFAKKWDAAAQPVARSDRCADPRRRRYEILHPGRQIAEDRRTGIVTVSIIWRDRVSGRPVGQLR